MQRKKPFLYKIQSDSKDASHIEVYDPTNKESIARLEKNITKEAKKEKKSKKEIKPFNFLPDDILKEKPSPLLIYKNTSEKSNYGLIADRDFEPEEIVCNYRGNITHSDNHTDKFYAFKLLTGKMKWVGKKQRKFNILSAETQGSSGRFVNHNYNCNVKFRYTDKQDNTCFIATKPIHKGEQILLNYGPQYWKIVEIDPEYINPHQNHQLRSEFLKDKIEEYDVAHPTLMTPEIIKAFKLQPNSATHMIFPHKKTTLKDLPILLVQLDKNKNIIVFENQPNLTPLMFACFHKNYEEIKRIIEITQDDPCAETRNSQEIVSALSILNENCSSKEEFKKFFKILWAPIHQKYLEIKESIKNKSGSMLDLKEYLIFLEKYLETHVKNKDFSKLTKELMSILEKDADTLEKKLKLKKPKKQPKPAKPREENPYARLAKKRVHKDREKKEVTSDETLTPVTEKTKPQKKRKSSPIQEKTKTVMGLDDSASSPQEMRPIQNKKRRAPFEKHVEKELEEKKGPALGAPIAAETPKTSIALSINNLVSMLPPPPVVTPLAVDPAQAPLIQAFEEKKLDSATGTTAPRLEKHSEDFISSSIIDLTSMSSPEPHTPTLSTTHAMEEEKKLDSATGTTAPRLEKHSEDFISSSIIDLTSMSSPEPHTPTLSTTHAMEEEKTLASFYYCSSCPGSTYYPISHFSNPFHSYTSSPFMQSPSRFSTAPMPSMNMSPSYPLSSTLPIIPKKSVTTRKKTAPSDFGVTYSVTAPVSFFQTRKTTADMEAFRKLLISDSFLSFYQKQYNVLMGYNPDTKMNAGLTSIGTIKPLYCKIQSLFRNSKDICTNLQEGDIIEIKYLSSAHIAKSSLTILRYQRRIIAILMASPLALKSNNQVWLMQKSGEIMKRYLDNNKPSAPPIQSSISSPPEVQSLPKIYQTNYAVPFFQTSRQIQSQTTSAPSSPALLPQVGKGRIFL